MPASSSTARSVTRVFASALPGATALVVAAILALATTLLWSSPLSAETPSRVAEGLADDGVFVGVGRPDADEEALAAAVADARRDRLDLVVVVPRDPQPSAKAFARRIQELTEADVALVFPSDGPMEAYAIDELSSARPRAIEAARVLDDPARAVAAFAEEVNSTDAAGRPPIIGQIIRALVICSLLIGAVVAIEVAISKVRRTAPAS